MSLRPCWCANTALVPFGRGYHRCPKCQTLVATAPSAGSKPAVKNDDADFYGRNYWFNHQTQTLGCPDILTRSRTDLAERCIHWLRTLLPFVLPPARVLEIGCAHGGFVAMLRQAGYDALGLELSPAIVEFAQQTFQIPVLTGPIEQQNLPDQSFDAIILMDVVEHLPNPLETLSHCLRLLKPAGKILIQMPEYPAPRELSDLLTANHKFPQMLDPNEHLYLFSRHSTTILFQRLNCPHIEHLPAIFDFYDQFLITSPQSLIRHSEEQIDTALSRTPQSRILRALLDLDSRRLNLLTKYRELRDNRGAGVQPLKCDTPHSSASSPTKKIA